MSRGEEAKWLFSAKGIDIEIEKPWLFHRSWKTAPGLRMWEVTEPWGRDSNAYKTKEEGSGELFSKD